MSTDDREQQFERALTRHLSNASPDSACPDAETLAAYHDRALSLEEMARWKEHIAGCLHCQESLALVEQTENLPAEEWERQNEPTLVQKWAVPQTMRAERAGIETEEPLSPAPLAAAAPASPLRILRPRPPWRWIVPIGALAAGVIAWIGVREIRVQHIQQMSSAQMAQNRQAASPLPETRYESSDQLQKVVPPPQEVNKESRHPSAPTSPSTETVPPQVPGSLSERGVPSSSSNDMAFNNRKDSPPASAGGRIAATPPPSSVSGYMARNPSGAALPPPAAKAAASSAPAPNPPDEKKQTYEKAPPSMSETVEVQSAAPAVITNSAETAEMGKNELPSAVSLLQLATEDRRYIVAPGENHAWRLGDAGKIERSTDRGKSWKLQKTSVTADLTAGSATSDKVCWAVGRVGTILLTTDGGKHWRLISSPITGDLGGVHATDAMHASIWDVPNRNSFETNDGGATWNRTANE
jgi:hypothetical protein